MKSCRHFRYFVAWRITLANGSGIYKGLEGRPNLPLSLFYVVVLEIFIVIAPNPCFYKSGFWIETNQSRLKYTFVVQYTIHWRKQGIYFTFPGKHTHRYFFGSEKLLNAIGR